MCLLSSLLGPDSVSPGEEVFVWSVTPVLLKIIYLRALQKYIGKRKIKSPLGTGKSVLPSGSPLETLPEEWGVRWEPQAQSGRGKGQK